MKELMRDLENSKAKYTAANPWQHFEVLCVQFRHLVLSLLYENSMQITAANLWRGATFYSGDSDRVLGSNVALDTCDYLTLEYPKHQQPTAASFICRNADKAHAGDCIIKLNDSIIDEQHRHTTNPKADTITRIMLESDMKNRMPSIRKYKKQNLKYQGIAYISNLYLAKKKENLPSDDDLEHKFRVLAIVDRSNLREHFSEAIATYLNSLGFFSYLF
jgi:hypothetical protein